MLNISSKNLHECKEITEPLFYLQQIQNREEDKDQIVIVLLNMLEVVTRDIMDEEVPR